MAWGIEGAAAPHSCLSPQIQEVGEEIAALKRAVEGREYHVKQRQQLLTRTEQILRAAQKRTGMKVGGRGVS